MVISAIRYIPSAKKVIGTFLQEGCVVYSTASKGGATAGTMFDAFCKTMQKSKVAKDAAKKVVGEAEKMVPELEAKAYEILKNSGANATVSCRVKSVESSASKIQKEFRNFKDYESSRRQIQEIIRGNGAGELVCDAYGMRFTTNQDAIKLYNEFLRQHGRNFQVTCFEDYFGRGITPYGGEQVANRFKQLKYLTSYGETRNTIGLACPKATGYTRTNSNMLVNGVKVEAQVGGVHTIKWGDAEHYLYDIRQGKSLDLSKLTPEQIKIFKEIKREYTKLLANPKLNQAYTENYLNKIWGALKKSEEQNLAIPLLPDLPAGISHVLSAENIMKLV